MRFRSPSKCPVGGKKSGGWGRKNFRRKITKDTSFRDYCTFLSKQMLFRARENFSPRTSDRRIFTRFSMKLALGPSLVVLYRRYIPVGIRSSATYRENTGISIPAVYTGRIPRGRINNPVRHPCRYDARTHVVSDSRATVSAHRRVMRVVMRVGMRGVMRDACSDE